MIWIATLCLLILAAWLFFNALNERRWVQAHSHDETVASDAGFLPSFSGLTRSGTPGADGKLSIGQEGGLFASAVSRVQEKTAKYGDKFFEKRAAAARYDNDEDRPRSAKEENTIFGRAVARIGEKADQMDRKLDDKIKAASNQTSYPDSVDGQGGEEAGYIARATRKVTAKSDELSQRVAHRAKNMADGYADRSASDGEGLLGKGEELFGKMVNKVSDGMDKVEAKVTSKRTADNKNEDAVSQAASSVASSSKDTVNKPDLDKG